MDRALLHSTVQLVAAERENSDLTATSSRVSAVGEEVGKRLGFCIHQAVKEWNARVLAGPKTYVPASCHCPTLSKGMQDVISQLCTAVNSEKTRAPYLRRFAHHVIFDEYIGRSDVSGIMQRRHTRIIKACTNGCSFTNLSFFILHYILRSAM